MVGHKLGRAISDIVARTNMQVRQAMLRPEQAEIARRHTAQAEIWERELAVTNQATLRSLAARDDLPPDVAALVGKIAKTTNQTDLAIQLAVVVGTVMGAGHAAAEPTLQWMSNTVWHDNPRRPLPPDVAALLIAHRRRLSHDVEDTVRDGGWSAGRLQDMVDATYTMPALSESLELWRKGEISEDDFLLWAGRSGLDPETVHHLAALRWRTLDPGTATAARVEGHIGWPEHAEALATHGIDPKWADVMYHTAGRPPGIAELLQLVNRGIIGEDRVSQAILESDIKDKYIPDILQMRVYLPPARSIVAMMRSGAIDTTRGQQLLQQHGLSAEDSAAFVREATHGRTQQAKEIAAGTALSMFAEQEIDRNQCSAILANLHYDGHSADLLLADAETRRERKERDALATRVRSQLVSKHISRSEASLALDRAGVSPARRDMLLRLWELEAASVRPVLSVAQLNAAHKKGVISDQQLTQYLLRLGYSADDARVLVETQGGTYTP